MIRIRLLQNTVFFVDKIQAPHTQRQWHVQFGDIHAVDKVNVISENQYQFILPTHEVINNIDKGIVEIIQGVPQAKSSGGGCGGCDH